MTVFEVGRTLRTLRKILWLYFGGNICFAAWRCETVRNATADDRPSDLARLAGQKRHPEFLQAIQEGRQRSQLWWEERALAVANGEAGNTQIVMLGLRNRSRAATGWNNDTVKLEHTGPEGGPVEVESTHKVDIESLSHEHRDQLREILLAAKALGIKTV
jgi:hypothetical protein